MNKIDWLSLDARLLQLLVTVQEAGSVTGAAQRLGLTQSAVSHGLDRLRAIVGDPLFVKSGRGIVATAQAGLLAQRARHLLDELEAFSVAAGFEPARLNTCFTIAANDLQRDLLLPPLLPLLRLLPHSQGPEAHPPPAASGRNTGPRCCGTREATGVWCGTRVGACAPRLM